MALPSTERPRGAIYAAIRALVPSMTSSEQAVAALVVANEPSDVVRWSVDVMAQKAGVSTSSVMRFCHVAGFAGFKDFKLALAADTGSASVLLTGDVGTGDTVGSIARKVFQSDVNALQQTVELLDEVALERAVNYLNAARTIALYGIGSSAPIANDAYYRFLRIGLSVTYVPDALMMLVSASLLRTDDVALFVSHTGRTAEVVAAAEAAKVAGAVCIGITSFARTPFADLMDVVLLTATGESRFRVEAMSSRIAHLSLVDTLYTALAVRRFEHALRTLEHSNALIEGRRVE